MEAEELAVIPGFEEVFAEAGLAAHSADDLRRLTAGKLVGWSFGVGEDNEAGAPIDVDALWQPRELLEKRAPRALGRAGAGGQWADAAAGDHGAVGQ